MADQRTPDCETGDGVKDACIVLLLIRNDDDDDDDDHHNDGTVYSLRLKYEAMINCQASICLNKCEG